MVTKIGYSVMLGVVLICGAVFAGLVQAEKQFELVDIFEIVVPEDYNHDTRLTTFSKEHHDEFTVYRDFISDQNYGKVTTKLVPGQKLKVEVFQINGSVSSGDCLTYLRSQNALLVGAQGLSLVYEQGKNHLPSSIWWVSFDKKSNLLADVVSGFHLVPMIAVSSDGDFCFYTCPFEARWHKRRDGVALLCFTEVE